MVALTLIGVGDEKAAIALSKASLLPRYPLICAGAPDRAWARASAQPQISAYWIITPGVNNSTRARPSCP